MSRIYEPGLLTVVIDTDTQLQQNLIINVQVPFLIIAFILICVKAIPFGSISLGLK